MRTNASYSARRQLTSLVVTAALATSMVPAPAAFAEAIDASATEGIATAAEEGAETDDTNATAATPQKTADVTTETDAKTDETDATTAGKADEKVEEKTDEKAEEKTDEKAQGIVEQAKILTVQAKADEVTESGDVRLSVKADELKGSDIEVGDLVNVTLGTTELTVSAVADTEALAAGTDALIVADANVTLTRVGGSFAKTHDVKAEDEVTLELASKGGALTPAAEEPLVYTDDRADYQKLTDAQFANFRAVTTTGMGVSKLFRTSSPLDATHKRNTYADEALKAANVTVIVNLANTEDEIAAFEGYDKTYYATAKHVAAKLEAEPSSEAFKQALAKGLRLIAENPGTYAIHGSEGITRTGLVCALLECLMGATADEVVADYMASYANYYGLTSTDARWQKIADDTVVKMLREAFGVDDLKGTDLAAKARTYLVGCGLTEAEVDAIKANLGSATNTHTVTFQTNGRGTAPTAQTVRDGQTATKPADPTAEGYTFGGWYTDATLSQEYDFSKAVTSDLTLYAKWTPVATAATGSGSKTTTTSPQTTSRTLATTSDPTSVGLTATLLASASTILAVALRLKRRVS